MIKKCAFFYCTSKDTCTEKDCSGSGGDAYQNCGCDVCINKSFADYGDVEICEVALDMREADMEEKE